MEGSIRIEDKSVVGQESAGLAAVIDLINELEPGSKIKIRKKANICEVQVKERNVIEICRKLEENDIKFNVALAWNHSFHDATYFPILKFGEGIKKPLTIEEVEKKMEDAVTKAVDLWKSSRVNNE